MKAIAALLVAMAVASTPALATRFAITTPGDVFSPSTVTIQTGDTVVFTISVTHNAVEVSQATWNANGTAPLAGGFSFGVGTFILAGLTTGTHYYVCQPHVLIGMKALIIVNPVTGVDDDVTLTPQNFELGQNYPNPFNPSTSISYTLARTAYTEIAVYDALGRLIKTLVAGTAPAGVHETLWDGTDDKGEAAGTGAYFIVMSAGENGVDYFGTNRVLLIR